MKESGIKRTFQAASIQVVPELVDQAGEPTSEKSRFQILTVRNGKLQDGPTIRRFECNDLLITQKGRYGPFCLAE